MKHELITEENVDRFDSQKGLPNLLAYPIKKISENVFQVEKKETVIFWGDESGQSIKSKTMALKPIGKFDHSLKEALVVLKSALPPSQAFLIHIEGNNISRAMVPLLRK